MTLLTFYYFYISFLAESKEAKHKSSKEKISSNPTGTMLSEDYAEIVEEGDYSVPAGNFKFVIVLHND